MIRPQPCDLRTYVCRVSYGHCHGEISYDFVQDYLFIYLFFFFFFSLSGEDVSIFISIVN